MYTLWAKERDTYYIKENKRNKKGNEENGSRKYVLYPSVHRLKQTK